MHIDSIVIYIGTIVLKYIRCILVLSHVLTIQTVNKFNSNFLKFGSRKIPIDTFISPTCRLYIASIIVLLYESSRIEQT